MIAMAQDTHKNKSEFKIIWANRYLMIKGNSYDAAFHSHHAIQISLATETPLSIQTDREIHIGDVIIINHQVKHALAMNEGSIMVLIEPNSKEGQILRKWLGEEEVKIIDNLPDLKSRLSEYDSFIEERPEEIEMFFKMIIKAITQEIVATEPIDDRIRACLEHIEANMDENDFSIPHLAEVVFLSESRLQHLFKEQVGVPVTSYIQWFKVLRAAKYILSGKSITEAAHRGAFADSAHFSRAFKGMFGKSFSKYLKDSRIIQVIFV